MSEFRDQFLDMIFHASETMQEPTAWEVGRTAGQDMLRNAESGNRCSDLTGKTPFKHLGIDVITNTSLPEGRVVLKCGENTAGAFSLSRSE